MPVALAATIARGAWQAPARVAAHLPPPPMLTIRERPPDFTRILLAVEDPKFFDHRGIDLRSPGAGWTSITQGLVKVLYFERFRPGPLAKLEQTLLAVGFDAATPKRLQFDLFWNCVYLGTRGGESITGFPRAAIAWFGRDVKTLDRRGFLTLVAMVMAPNRFSPEHHPDANAERVARIERLLAGLCQPKSWRDVEYQDCGSGGVSGVRSEK
ncbi:MAG: transglycosylase domain-containing protein [Thermoanaerobaculia bacterium]